ncbi:YitT family protein [Paenibacillus xerothermodurans]|uniref:YitT family protein n=1 Tax=Paenibacillus xerothermodurans TaxID=1977292 RepID=A0A2W1ND29_PAEXE|nr:YitT family protein [Paenibacillus xerothermodurans]PZE22599.1 hypothetical protein CBW46_002150 [Paenibacillus xerothermodurans]
MLSVRKIAAIIFGSLMISIGINFFLMPFKVLDGGVIGLALIINYLFGVQVGLVMFLCSIPIFVVAWLYDPTILYNSLVGLMVSSLFIDLMVPFHFYFMYYIELSPFSSAALGGFIVGTGIGVMLRYETSTGGTDLLAQHLSKTVSVNVGIVIFIIDGIIISLGGLLISAETFLLSIITITAGGMATSLCTLK